MSVQDDKNTSPAPEAEDERVESVSRRAMIRGGVTAMPAILTLQSGAALARSSNMISAAPPGTTDQQGRTLCLDTNSVYPAADSGHVYDLGEPPRAEVNIITDRDYRTYKHGRHDRWREGNEAQVKVAESTMCEEGGTYWYNDRDGRGWQAVELPQKGIVVSSGAMTSMADDIIDTLL